MRSICSCPLIVPKSGTFSEHGSYFFSTSANLSSSRLSDCIDDSGVESPFDEGCDRGDVGSVEQTWNGLADMNEDVRRFGRAVIDATLEERGSLDRA